MNPASDRPCNSCRALLCVYPHGRIRSPLPGRGTTGRGLSPGFSPDVALGCGGDYDSRHIAARGVFLQDGNPSEYDQILPSQQASERGQNHVLHAPSGTGRNRCCLWLHQRRERDIHSFFRAVLISPCDTTNTLVPGALGQWCDTAHTSRRLQGHCARSKAAPATVVPRRLRATGSAILQRGQTNAR